MSYGKLRRCTSRTPKLFFQGTLSVTIRGTLIVRCLLMALVVSGSASADELPSEFSAGATAPIFTAQAGAWDAKIRERGWILQEDGVWKLWYTGYDPDKSPVTMKLGHATSPDGIHWKRSDKNPLVSEYWVEDMMVVRHEGVYYMFSEGFEDQAQLMESADGVTWTRRGTLDVRLMNGQPIPPGPYGTPTAYFEKDCWYLFYERRDEGVWLATSTDMKVWTNVSDTPVISRGPEAFDRQMLAMNQVQKVGDRYVAVLHGTSDEKKPRRWVPYLAESSDLRNWRKATSPLRPIEENRSSGMLLQDGDSWRFYTTHDRVDVYFPQ